MLFTGVSGFSEWVLEAGDGPGLELLRLVAAVVEPEVTAHRGRLVKRLAGGHMAVFGAPALAVAAAFAMRSQVREITVDGHRPQLCSGVHTGEPQWVSGDLIGTDVNIAARVFEAARPGELLVSGAALDRIDAPLSAQLDARRRRFRAKGVPPGLPVFAVQLRSDP